MFSLRREILVCAVAGVVFAAASANACEGSDQAGQTHYDIFTKSDGPVSFQPDRPANPVEGHVWIDARTGDQHIFLIAHGVQDGT